MTRTEERWEKIQSVFLAASDLPAMERERLLIEECADALMYTEVRLMLEEDEKSAPFRCGGLRSMAAILETDVDELPASREIGPYTLTRLLGEGGSGRVYLARRVDVGSVVAVKLLRDAWVSAARRDRFASEQRIVAQLKHPLIASLYDAGLTADGTPYFVMEYVDGIPLTKYCTEHCLTLSERLKLFCKVCESVRYAHSQAIIHRDIKPSNILITPEAEVKLLDFGIARQMDAVDDGGENTRTGLRMMTPMYASPEQWLAQRPGLQTDIYSLGIVLYELLAGCLPFDLTHVTPSEAERVITQQEHAAPSMSIRRNSSPRGMEFVAKSEWDDLDVMCLKAMQKEPERRYETVDALMQDVNAFLAGEPLKARPDSWQYRTAKFVRRNRRAVTATAIGALLVVMLAGGFVWRLDQERQAALSETAHADRLLQFTLNLFDGGQGDAGPRSDLRVAQLLARGSKEASTLQGDPLRQSEMFMTLGWVFYKTAQYDEAEADFRAAAAIRRQFAGPPLALAESQIALAFVDSDLGHFDEAEKEAREGIATMERVKGPRDAASLQAKVSLGYAQLSRGQYSSAIQTLEPVVQVQQASGSSEVDRASALHQLAVAYQLNGDNERARQAVNSSLSLHLSLYGAAHPSVAADEQWLCEQDLRRFDFVVAEGRCRKALSIDQEWYGADSTDTVVAMRTLGSVLTAENKLAEAKPLLDHALSFAESTGGSKQEGVATATRDLGTWAYQSGNYQAAEEYYDRSLSIFKRIYGDRDYHVAVIKLRLGVVSIKRKGCADAEFLIRQALAINLEAQGPLRTNTGLAHIVLGHVLLCEKRFAVAKQESQLGYEIVFRQNLPQGEFFDMAKKDLAEEAIILGRLQ